MTMLTEQQVAQVIAPDEGDETVDILFAATMLLNLRGAAPISFIAHTDVNDWKSKSKKKNPLVDRVRKHALVNGMVNFHYDEGVERRLAKELGAKAEKNNETLTDAELTARVKASFRKGQSYHVPVMSDNDKLTPLCIHKDDAATIVGLIEDNGGTMKNKVHTFHVADLGRFVEQFGRAPRLYIRFMFKHSNPIYVETETQTRINDATVAPYLKTKEERNDYANQGLEEPLKFLTYSLDSIRQLTMDKTTYLIR